MAARSGSADSFEYGLRDVVDSGENDDRPGRRQDGAHVHAPVRRSMQILHLAGVAEIQPVSQKRQLRIRRRRRDAAEVEASDGRLALDLGG